MIDYVMWNNAWDTKFNIADAKIHVSVVTLSTQDNLTKVLRDKSTGMDIKQNYLSKRKTVVWIFWKILIFKELIIILFWFAKRRYWTNHITYSLPKIEIKEHDVTAEDNFVFQSSN